MKRDTILKAWEECKSTPGATAQINAVNYGWYGDVKDVLPVEGDVTSVLLVRDDDYSTNRVYVQCASIWGIEIYTNRLPDPEGPA